MIFPSFPKSNARDLVKVFGSCKFGLFSYNPGIRTSKKLIYERDF